MSLFQISTFSQTLGKETNLLVVMPEGHKGPMRVVYQLHGYGDCAHTWIRETCIERYARQHQLMVVMPEGGKNYYTDAQCGYRNYESHILETITFVDEHFQTIQSRLGRGIGGVGMGGYGAMKLGLKHNELFASVSAHSASFDLTQTGDEGSDCMLQSIFGDEVSEENDCFSLAENIGKRAPAIHIDCGTRDKRHENCLDFHKHLKEQGIKHRFAEYPGGHTWAYWEAHLQEDLAFHNANLHYQGL